MQARELGRRSVVVGDQVALVGDLSGASGSLARIVRVEPRTTTLRRSADDTDPLERVIVANADQLVIVASLADPPPRTGLVDRCLVAAYVGGLSPLLCLTKADLLKNGHDSTLDDMQANYRDLDVSIVISDLESGPAQLLTHLTGRLSVLVGHSGVGKSTLVNRLVPGAERAIGEISAIGKGRHTSSSAIALALPDGGWIIDTPGIRSFGLAHVRPEDLLGAFPDLVPGTDDCPRGCEHTNAEPECGLNKWVEEGKATPGRLASFRRLLESLNAE